MKNVSQAMGRGVLKQRPKLLEEEVDENRRGSFEHVRSELSTRLRERQAEIEHAVLNRIISVSETNKPLNVTTLDPEYLHGLHIAISAGVDFGLEVIERGEERAPPPPPALLAQARLAVRFGVGLDTILRRYSAGFVLLTDYLVEEIERSRVRGVKLQRLLRAQVALDHVLAAISEEYTREANRRPSTSEARRAERVERLLAGELLDTSGLAYEFECTHLAVIACGNGASQALRDLASTFDCRLLSIRRGERTIWAWLGSKQSTETCRLHQHASENWPTDITVAFGEQGEGLTGWRRSHREAKAALFVAMRSSKLFIRYADVAVLATVLQDDLLVTLLRRLYVEPLKEERDGGEVALNTLRAYFGAGRNVSSAAASLGVSRQAVGSRLRVVENRLGRSLDACAVEIEIALSLAELEDPAIEPADFPLR